MSDSEPKGLIERQRVEELLKVIAERDPELARILSIFYIATDKCCLNLKIIFPQKDVDYELRVRAIDPFLRGRNKFMVGATVYLGISNNYIDKLINAGQIVILYRSDSSLDCEGYIYKSVNSVIVRDNQLDKLSEWIRVAQYILERDIPKAMEIIKE